MRILVRDAASRIDGGFFRAQIDRAVELRATLGLPGDQTNGYRLIHAEGDGLPGLIVAPILMSLFLAVLRIYEREIRLSHRIVHE